VIGPAPAGPADARDGGGLRLAAVSYVNAWPLTAGLEDEPGVDLLTTTPAGVADLLAAGEVDAGLVPSIELARQPGLEVIAGAGISAFGPVDSVLLLLRTAPHLVRTLALDPASRTSQVLAQLVLEHVHGARPAALPIPPAEAWANRLADAVLVIGDAALGQFAAEAPALDLAAEWSRWTGLPFVFAVWAAPRGSHARSARLRELLAAASRRGAASVAALAQRAAAGGPLDAQGFEVYLTRRIRYGLGEWEMRGLRRFLDLAERMEGIRRTPCST
jgi:predicted solute-binding protein